MSQNVTHKKKIARALVARTGMSYTHARKLVQAAAQAGVLEPPFSDERLPVVVDAILGSPLVAAHAVEEGGAVGMAAALASAESIPLVAGGPGSQTVTHNPPPEVPSFPAQGAPAVDDWSRVARVKFPETGNRWWTVRATHGHFTVLTQQVPFQKAGTLRYTVIDTVRDVRGPVNTIGNGWSGIETDRGCKVLARVLSLGMREVSHRNNVPIEPTTVEWVVPSIATPGQPDVTDPAKTGRALAKGVAAGATAARRQKTPVNEPAPQRAWTGPEALASALETGRDLANGGGGRLVHEVNTHDVAGMLRRTAVLIASGMPMATCIDLAARSAKAPVLRAAMADVAIIYKEGWSIHEAFGAYPVLFDDFVVASVFAGEQSGAIERLLISAAEAIAAERPRTLVASRFAQGALPRGERKALVLNT